VEYLLKEIAEDDDSVDALGQLPGNLLHQRNHALVAAVMSRDDPDHPQCIHHRRQCVNHLQWPVNVPTALGCL